MLVGKERYDILENTLSQSDGLIKDEDQTMTILSQLAANSSEGGDYNHTLYSTIYNLSDKTLDLVVNENYDEPEMTFHFDLL